MKKQTIHTLVLNSNGVLKVLKTDPIFHPKINYRGKGIKWYEDKLKKIKKRGYKMRKCKVNEKEAYFHQWNTFKNVIEPSLMMGGHPGGEIQYTLGMIEYDDGTVTEVAPSKIVFLDKPEL